MKSAASRHRRDDFPISQVTMFHLSKTGSSIVVQFTTFLYFTDIYLLTEFSFSLRTNLLTFVFLTGSYRVMILNFEQ